MSSRPTKPLSAKNKGKGKATIKPSKRPVVQKVSNRPRDSSSEEESDAEDQEDERAAMLAALEAHQASFLAEALPSTSNLVNSHKKNEARKEKEVKPIWEMEMDDFEDDDDEEEESEEDGDVVFGGQGSSGAPSANRSVATVIAFEDPGASASAAAGTRKDMRNFMSSKVKNARKTIGVADLANAPMRGKVRSVGVTSDLTAEEESHLASLDTHLSTLIRPLTSSSSLPTHSQLPSLLSSLPLAPTKTLKGLTPLPSNAPRTLRAGQSAANLKRAKARDDAAGVLAGQKRGREALSLKEKRREDGDDKRQRGLGGSVGKMVRGGLVISKQELRGFAEDGSGKKRGGGGGKRGKGKKR